MCTQASADQDASALAAGLPGVWFAELAFTAAGRAARRSASGG